MRTVALLFFALSLLVKCTPEGGSAPGAAPEGAEIFNPDLYILSDIGGSDLKRAERRNADGTILEEGFIQDGKKTGTWVTYHPKSMIPKLVVSYVDGKYNGIYLEFNDRGNLETRAGYSNNLLHGHWAKYKFGRPTNEADYVNGQLDGIYREYLMNTGKLQKEITYRNGVMNGPYRFFNEEGNVTVEYEYRNGEKVSGGMVGSD